MTTVPIFFLCWKMAAKVFLPLAIPDVVLIRPRRHSDLRGWFAETFNLTLASEMGWPNFVQDNESFSISAGTIRGLHFQRPPYGQAKLVSCVAGALFDVALDIRENSPTYGQHVTARLDPQSGDQLFIPEGFAHGFCSLEPGTVVRYKASAVFARDHEGGVVWNDPLLGINWPVRGPDAILSDRDRKLSPLASLKPIGKAAL